jgi:2-polyprenyl-6-methoxyphenol hydroxylase-like FAD-dependent oxidoreductase
VPPQVLIAGAGPVGLFLAASLRRLGIGVRIIDKAVARSATSRALVIWPRTLETLQIDGSVEPFLAAGLRITDARIVAGSHPLAHISFAAVQSEFPYALFLPQNETERLLEATLNQRGVQVEREVELVDFTHDQTARLRQPDGAVETVRTDWLVGCDGAHSTVRHTLQLPFGGDTLPSTWILADILIAGPLPREVLVSWSPDGLLALFPMTADRFRVIADMGETNGSSAPPTLEEVQQILAARGPGGLTAHDPIWLNRFHINERKVADYRVGRVFVIGDAAHVHSPAGGQGMNTGMQDAANLAWKLALVCQGAADDRLLDSVSVERSAIGEQVLRNAGRLTRLAIMRNPILRHVRDTAIGFLGTLPAFRQRIIDAMTELDLHYAESPLNGPAAHAASCHPGARAAEFRFGRPDGSFTTLSETLRSGRFLVLSVGQPGEPATPVELAAAAATLAETIWTDTEQDQYRPGFHYVIRPDGYVAMVAAAKEPERVGEYFGRWLPQSAGP